MYRRQIQHLVRFDLQAVAAHDAEIMVASHNQASVERAVRQMHDMGLDQTQVGVYFGQLLGMADPLSFVLGANGYKVRESVDLLNSRFDSQTEKSYKVCLWHSARGGIACEALESCS